MCAVEPVCSTCAEYNMHRVPTYHTFYHASERVLTLSAATT